VIRAQFSIPIPMHKWSLFNKIEYQKKSHNPIK